MGKTEIYTISHILFKIKIGLIKNYIKFKITYGYKTQLAILGSKQQQGLTQTIRTPLAL